MEVCFKTGGVCSIGHLKTKNDQIYIGRPYKAPYSDYCKYGIIPAIEELGFTPWEAIEHHGKNDLLCKICQGIQTSSAAVIDISEPSPNVHFELGILAGLSKPSILVKQQEKPTPTDLQGMEVVEYADASSLGEEVKKRLEEVARNRSFSQITPYPTYQAYYNDLLLMLDKATTRIDLTHIRNQPPDDFRGVNEWFNRVLHWAEDHPMGRLRRIIAVANGDMYEWAESLHEVEKKLETANFEVRVCDWQSSFPSVNMAIFDRKIASIALTSSDATDTAGFSVTQPLITEYFVDYYNNIWSTSVPLGRFLEEHDRSEFV